MYRGFKLEISEDDFNNNTSSNLNKISSYDQFIYDNYYKKGFDLFESYEINVETNLKKFISDGKLDGTAIQDNWFPEISDCHIFISHSHKDKELAIALAGLLKEEYNLNSFIDSCIWGYADKLLKIIDNEWCKNPDNLNYNYKKRNSSTSHVHMMLNMALMQMIDKTECLFFLNTPNSISLSDIKTQTLSPWIYSEIGISRMIEKKSKRRLEAFCEGGQIKHFISDAKITYDLNLSHLCDLDKENIFVNKGKKGTIYLDYLYAKYPLLPRN
ncbi:MAG: hypothetical protein SO179_04145 [Bacteroidales bacterium]|nr:hypothetical protein [Bacteroidales bacterium]